MQDFKPQKFPLHRSWLRLLPFGMLGAFLISLETVDSANGLLENYLFLLGVEVAIIVLYLSVNKILKKSNKI
jgi:hypothetical protein